MEQPQKGTPPVNSKEKKSFLDEDIGNDFLSSWKSMAATKDDGMDFSFNMASSGTNKAFNFDKMDMDFGLDGDFDKLDSFKVDMSDFDLPATSKKATKPKESSADESSNGKVKEKKGPFNFSFDFNELDDFNFESSLGKKEKVSNTSKDDQKKKSSAGTKQKSSNDKLSDDCGAFDETMATELLSASKPLATESMETSLTGQKHLNAIKEDYAISSGARDSSCNLGSSPEEEITDRTVTIEQRTHMSEKEICSPDRTPNTVESNRNSIIDEDKFSSSPKDDENGKITEPSSSHKIVPLKNSGSSLGDEKNKPDTDSPTETMDDHESDLCVLDLRENSKSSICSAASLETKEYNENQNSAAELPTDISSEPVGAISTTIDAKEPRALNVKLSEGEESALETKYPTSERERTGPMILETNMMGINSDDGQPGTKSDGSNPEPAARELMRGEEKNVQHLSNTCNIPNKEGLTSNSLPNISTLENRKLVVSTSENPVKVQSTIGFQGSSSILQRKDKFDSPTSSNTKLIVSSLESAQKSKNKSIEGSKLRSPKKINNLSVLNISKTKSSVKVPDSAPKKDINSLQNPKHGMEAQDNAEPEIPYLQIGINVSNTKSSVRVPESAPKKGISSLQHPKHVMEAQDNAASETAYLQNSINISKTKTSVRVPDSAPNKDINLLQNPKHGIKAQSNAVSESAYLQNGINFSKTKSSVKVPDSAPKKDISLLQKPKHAMEAQDNTAPEIAYLHSGTEKKLPLNFSLKRKAFELQTSDSASQKPLKRLSPPIINRLAPKSHRGLNEPSKLVVEEKLSSAVKNLRPLIYRSKAPVGREVKEPSPRVDGVESMRKTQEGKVFRHEEQKESRSKRNLLYGSPFGASKPESPQVAKMMDFEPASSFNSNGNMEKAEAYAKELEDICNMLKKKHEEAKDVLIRALVNNNNLLMLNHPIYDDNICKVQKFAARLMSKELQT